MTTTTPTGAAFGSSWANRDARAREGLHLRAPLTLCDVTLREGEQAAEVAFTRDDKRAIASALLDVGVPVVQVGYPDPDTVDVVASLRRDAPDARLATLVVGWSDTAPDGMRQVRDAGADVCSVLLRAADGHIANLGWDRSRVLDRAAELVAFGRDLGFADVMIAPSFATAADLDFLLAIYRAALDAGATVISLADSMGIASPAGIRLLIRELVAVAGDAGVRVHTHDDYGLALANALAAVECGANWVDVSVLGLGERAGNCALEEIAVAAEGLYGIETGVRLSGLSDLCALVATRTGVDIPPMKAIVGENGFTNKLEIHVKAAAADPSLMEPYDPVLVGNRRRIRIGRGSGPTGVRIKAAELGVTVDDDRIDEVVAAVNEWAARTKRSLTDDELRRVLAGEPPADEHQAADR